MAAESLLTRLSKIIPIFILGAMLSAGWFIRPAELAPIPFCFFKFITHLDCPGCGLTRSFLCLARGHLIEAIHYNAASPLIYLLFGLYFVNSILKLMGKEKRMTFPAWFSPVYGVLTVSLLFGHWFVRLYQGFNH